MDFRSTSIGGSGSALPPIPKPLPTGKKRCYALQALQYGSEMTVGELALAHRFDSDDAERGVALARANLAGEGTTRADRNSMHRSLQSLLKQTDKGGPWVERKTAHTPHKYQLIPVHSDGSPRTVRHSLMDGLVALIDAKLQYGADRKRINQIAKSGSFGMVVNHFANVAGMSEIDVRFRIAGASEDKSENVYEEQFHDEAWRWFTATRVADIRRKSPLVSENRQRVAIVGTVVVFVLALSGGIGILRNLQQPEIERIDTIDVAETPDTSATISSDANEPSPLEERPARLTIAENAVGVVPSNGDFTVVWDGPGGALGEQPVMASLATDEPIRSVTGRLSLNPGDNPDLGLAGGTSIHVYAQPVVGDEGGQEAQVFLVNTAEGALLDSATGICTTGDCYGTSDGYTTTDLTGIDPVDGVDFEFVVTGDQLTITIRSANDPTAREATIAAPFEGSIQAISLDIWGTQWPFVATLTDLTIEYE